MSRAEEAMSMVETRAADATVRAARLPHPAACRAWRGWPSAALTQAATVARLRRVRAEWCSPELLYEPDEADFDRPQPLDGLPLEISLEEAVAPDGAAQPETEPGPEPDPEPEPRVGQPAVLLVGRVARDTGHTTPRKRAPSAPQRPAHWVATRWPFVSRDDGHLLRPLRQARPSLPSTSRALVFATILPRANALVA